MKIFNIVLKHNNFFKLFILFILISFLIILLFTTLKLIYTNKTSSNIINIETSNYTDFLKDCHENINNYLDKKVKISGFVYRMNDFNKTQFVIARNMIFNDNKTSVVVGILCEYSEGYEYNDSEWIEITGKIHCTDYHGTIPYIKIESIKKIEPPQDAFVKEPSD